MSNFLGLPGPAFVAKVCALVDRYTSMGISNDARQFLDAAHLVRRGNPVWFGPTFFLVSQSIELSLKGFLRGSGYSEKQLRQLGHNLDDCVAAAKKVGIETYVTFSEVDLSSITSINKYYQGKDLQYSVAGYKSYPSQDWLLRLAERLWKTLRPFCVEHRDYHFGKATAIT